jgi:hypothetical protein
MQTFSRVMQYWQTCFYRIPAFTIHLYALVIPPLYVRTCHLPLDYDRVVPWST